MLKIERKLFDSITTFRFPFVISILLLFSILFRVRLLSYLSSDMTIFLIPWTHEIASHPGLSSFGYDIGNYSIFYRFIILLVSKMPFEYATSIKLFSILSDYLLAFVVGLIAYHSWDGKPNQMKKSVLAATLTTLLPLPILNSAFWGQCDSMYTFFIALSIYYLLKEKWTRSFVVFGFAFAIKLQALFFLPLLIMMYVSRKAFSALNFLVPPLVVFLTSLPAVILTKNIWVAVDIYKGQASGDDLLFRTYYNVSVLFSNQDIEYFKGFLILLAVLVLFGMIAIIWLKEYQILQQDIILFSAWSILACVLFLPNMHERYGFVAEICLWVYLVLCPSAKRLVLFCVFCLSGLSAYLSFLGGVWVLDVNQLTIANLLSFALLTYYIICKIVSHPSPIRFASPYSRPHTAHSPFIEKS